MGFHDFYAVPDALAWDHLQMPAEVISMNARSAIARFVIGVATAVGIVAAVGPQASASGGVIELGFVKDCPQWTCTGELFASDGTPLAGSNLVEAITLNSFDGGVAHISVAGAASWGDSNLSMDLSGIANYNQAPTTSVLNGTVSGTWQGLSLNDVQVHISAERLYGTTFGGTISIMPSS